MLSLHALVCSSPRWLGEVRPKAQRTPVSEPIVSNTVREYGIAPDCVTSVVLVGVSPRLLEQVSRLLANVRSVLILESDLPTLRWLQCSPPELSGSSLAAERCYVATGAQDPLELYLCISDFLMSQRAAPNRCVCIRGNAENTDAHRVEQVDEVLSGTTAVLGGEALAQQCSRAATFGRARLLAWATHLQKTDEPVHALRVFLALAKGAATPAAELRIARIWLGLACPGQALAWLQRVSCGDSARTRAPLLAELEHALPTQRRIETARLRENLQALVPFHPQLARALALRSSARVEVAQVGPRGQPLLLAADLGRIQPLNRLRTTPWRTGGLEDGLEHRDIMLGSLLDNWSTPQHIARTQPDARLFILEPELARLRRVFELVEVPAALMRTNVEVFAGIGCEARLARRLRALCCVPRMIGTVNDRVRSLLARPPALAGDPTQRTAGAVAVRLARGQSLRMAVCFGDTSSPSAVVAGALARAFATLGHDVELVELGRAAQRPFAGERRLDLIVLVDRSPSQVEHEFVRAVPCLTWMLTRSTAALGSRARRRLGDVWFVAQHERACELRAELGVPVVVLPAAAEIVARPKHAVARGVAFLGESPYSAEVRSHAGAPSLPDKFKALARASLRTGLPSALFGACWDGCEQLAPARRRLPLPGRPLQQMYAEHRVVLPNPSGEAMWSDVVNAIAAGGFVMVPQRSMASTRTHGFEQGTELCVYRSGRDALWKLHRAHHDEAWRAAYLRAGQARIQRDHLYLCRAQAMLKVAFSPQTSCAVRQQFAR